MAALLAWDVSLDSLFQVFRSCVGTAQGDVRRKTVRGWGRSESEGKPAVPFFKEELVPVYQNIPDSGIPYDWSILTALVSTRRFITLTGNVMR